MSWWKSLLLTCQILGLLVNTLSANDKYPVLNRDNLTIPIQTQLSQKQKTFSQYFCKCFKSRLNFEHIEKMMTFVDFLCLKLQTPKTWLDKCLKSLVSEDISTGNMVNGIKHCSNLHDRTFIIFFDQCQGNWVGKSLSY